jgi:acetyltransferase-like isoleucine patch superfamily enzyme
LGATIGSGVVINSKEVIPEPELVIIEDGCLIEDEAHVVCESVIDGELLMEQVLLGRCSRVRQWATVGRGAHLKSGHELISTSCLVGYGKKRDGLVVGGKVSKLEPDAVKPPDSQPVLRTLIGVPSLMLIDLLSLGPYYVVGLVWLVDLNYPLWVFLMATFGELVRRLTYIAVVVLTKWCLVGRVQPGSKANQGNWAGLRHWIVHTLLQREDFKEALDPFIQTEVLNFIYSCLGASVGRRACMDTITCATPDLLTIGDHVLFGSKVGIICETEDKKLPVEICSRANVLDNCVVSPGVTVGQNAILGTCTFASLFQYITPDTINTGNKGGEAVFLRTKGKGTPETVKLEAEANRRLDSPRCWTLFNIALISAALCEPLFHVMKVMPTIVALLIPIDGSSELDQDAQSINSEFERLCIALVGMVFVDWAEGLVQCLLKWCLIGRFKEQDVVFFSRDHFLWSVWLMITSSLGHMDTFHGTAMYSTFLRLLGSKVGRDCTLFGFALEFDLLHIGDHVHIADDCDNTCHTVENMVLKTVPVRLGNGSAMQRHSFVMPGAELSEGAILLEESQVLKGDIVPPHEIWAGNPAEPLQVRRRALSQLHRSRYPCEEAEVPSVAVSTNGCANYLSKLLTCKCFSQKQLDMKEKEADLDQIV